MFEIGWGELLVIGIVALIAIGPKELPGVLRMVGQWMGKVRRMASEFQNQFNEAMREAEMADLKKQVEEMSAAAVSKFEDPLETARKEIEGAMDDKPAAAAPPADAGAASAPSPPPAPPSEAPASTAASQADSTAPAATPPKAGEGS
jgi:sec-independent protein translocase protein TatB